MSKTTNNITDTVAATATITTSDSAQQTHYFKPHYVNGFHHNDSCCQDTTIAPMADSEVLEIPTGDKSENFMPSPLHDTGTMALFLFALFFITISYRKGYKYITDFKKNLFSTKKRENLFEDHNTVNETQILSALIANTCILEGILLNCAISFYHPSIIFNTNIFVYIISLVGFAALFYLGKLAMHYLLGYIFTNKVNTHLLVKGFQASQALLGLLLIPVVILLLVYPVHASIFITAFVVLYIFCTSIFIIKGFRIFFTNYTSILFFILYLCSGEIVPIIAMYNSALYLCSIF